MRPTLVAVGVLALLLLATVPASAAPALHKGNQANYALSASISFLQSCHPLDALASSSMILCPMMATMPLTVGINGTVEWTAIDVSTTSVSLNVTRDFTISNGDLGSRVLHSSSSFNESINLATRIVTLFPITMPEIDQALQIAQTAMTSSLPSGVNWSSSMSTLDNAMRTQPIYTMWWVNGPLKLNQTIPILFLPTNVTGTNKVDVGSTIGPRSAWTLAFNLSRSLPRLDPLATSPSSIPLNDDLELAFTFNYDQASDLLLSANADIHLGFGLEAVIQQSPCDASVSSSLCSSPSSPITIRREFGIDIQASLKLASATVDLNHHLTGSGPSQSGNSGSQSTSSGSGSSPGTGNGSDSSSGTNSSTSGTGQPTINTAQPKSSLQ